MSTFYRLLGFLRPYKRGLVASWLLASLAMVMTVLVPYLTGSAVEAIQKGTAHARPNVARDRIRPAHIDLRSSTAAGAELLRPPADRAADVPCHRRPAGRA